MFFINKTLKSPLVFGKKQKIYKEHLADFNMIINTTEQKGEEGVKGLIEITKPKDKKKNPIIEELEEAGVFD